MKVVTDGRLPLSIDKDLRFALEGILRDLSKSLNELVDTVLAKVNRTPVTADTLVKSGQVVYRGYIVTTVTATGPITLYDNTAESGTVVDVIAAATAAGTYRNINPGIVCETGLYAGFSGGATGTVLILTEAP